MNNMSHRLLKVTLAIMLTIEAVAASAQVASGIPIAQNQQRSSANPRLVRMTIGEGRGKIIAVVAPGAVYESSDEGSSFTNIADITFRAGAIKVCCAVLYEMPRSVGSIAAGTLLYSADFCDHGVMSTDIYSSHDQGRNWAFLSAPVRGGTCKDGKAVKNDGLWEPEFVISEDGALVMFWSDETDPCCSQKLSQIRTFDGSTWQDKKDTVALRNHAARPGMAVVSRTPHGFYFMTYELCGVANCDVMYRTSRDGWNFGPVADTGRKIVTRSGRYFEHAPRNIWFGSRPGDDEFEADRPKQGELLVIGQVLHEREGAVSQEDGEIIFKNSAEDGSGEWTSAPSPVKVPNAAANNYNVCQNYSSSLLPVREETELLELASDLNAQGVCASYYATEPFRP